MKRLIAVCLTLILTGVVFAAFSASAYNVISPTAPTYVESTKEEHAPYYTIQPKETVSADSEGEAESQITLPAYSEYDTFTNEGKDDPDSPNYTGEQSVSRDNSSRSPDTFDGLGEAPIAAAVATLGGVLAFTGRSVSKKKEK